MSLVHFEPPWWIYRRKMAPIELEFTSKNDIPIHFVIFAQHFWKKWSRSSRNATNGQLSVRAHILQQQGAPKFYETRIHLNFIFIV